MNEVKTNAFNFLPKIFTFSRTGHVKPEKLICKSMVYVQCSTLEARILPAVACWFIQVYRKTNSSQP